MPETTTVTCVITKEQKETLERLAEEKVCSVSFLVRQAIDCLLETGEQEKEIVLV